MFLWNFLSVLSTYKSNQTFLATFRSLSLSYLDKICFLASVRLYLLKLWTIVFKPLFYKCLSTWKFVQKKAQVFFLLHSLCYSTVFHRQIDIFFSLSTVSISHKKEISFRNKKYAVFAVGAAAEAAAAVLLLQLARFLISGKSNWLLINWGDKRIF